MKVHDSQDAWRREKFHGRTSRDCMLDAGSLDRKIIAISRIVHPEVEFSSKDRYR